MISRVVAFFCLLHVTLAGGNATYEQLAALQASMLVPPVSLKQSHNDFIVFCNEVFTDNANQKRSIAEFTQVAEQRKAEAQAVMATNQMVGLVMMMEASELIHRATGHILGIQNEAARWATCPYDTNAAWDYVEYHEELAE